MSNEKLDDAHAALLEELAAIEHQRWAHWQKFVHSKGQRQPDGSILLPADLVNRWEHQVNTSYSDLTNEEQESDREQVRKYFPLLKRWLSKQRTVRNDSA
jgi:hypothetical protein